VRWQIVMRRRNPALTSASASRHVGVPSVEVQTGISDPPAAPIGRQLHLAST
jgi:hypothetical protein